MNARRPLGLVLGVGLTTGMCIAQGPTLSNPDPAAVTGVPALRSLFLLAATRRVDFAMIGDSNARLGASASGHENAMGRAFAARFGMYATRVEPFAPTGGWGLLTQGESSWACSPFVGTLPDAVAALVFPNDTFACFPGAGAALTPGTSIASYYNCGLQVQPDSPIDISASLRYHLTHFVSVSASPGFFNLSAREGYPGNLYHAYAVHPGVATTGDSAMASDVFMDVPAGPRAGAGIMFCPVDAANGAGAQGPAVGLWHRVENTTRATGIAYSPLWAAGGRSARYTLFTMQTANIALPMVEWYRQTTRLQNAPPALCVHIMHGGNDCIDYSPSLGPIGGLNSSTPGGFEDNVRGIMALLRSWWALAGNDSTNLFFLIGPYHPRPGDDHDRQLGFELAARKIVASDPRIIAVAGNMLSTPAEFASAGYLLGGTDANHLSAPGFEAWSSTAVRAMDLALCPADYNGDHNLDVRDLFDFLAGWFAMKPTADVNHSRVFDVQDIFDFVRAWFAGC